jgi:PAS domain S-box-containing protein
MSKTPNFSALFDASPYPYLLIDTNFQIIGANTSYLTATGRCADDIVGKHIFEAFPANPSDPESTNITAVRNSISLAVSTRKPHTSTLLRYAIPVKTPDGTAYKDRYWSAVHTPVFNDEGEVDFVAQNAIDVTELYRFDPTTQRYYLKQDANAVPDGQQANRPQIHEAMTRILNAERSQLQTMFDQAPGFIAVLHGKEHVFEMANEAYYQLVGHRDIIGKPAMQALPELASQGFAELLDNVFAFGEPLVLRDRKISFQRYTGAPREDRFVDLLYQPIIGLDGRVTGIFAQGNDVTRAYQASMALAEKVQQLDEIRLNQAFQLELSDSIRPLSNPADVTEVACALLGRKLNASRVMYAEVDNTCGTIFMRNDWTAEGFASLAGQSKTMDDFGPDSIADLRAGRAVINDDVVEDIRTAAHANAFLENGVRAEIALPLIKNGKLRVVLAIHSANPRTWQEEDLKLARETAERTWSAVEASQAQSELRLERDRSQAVFDTMAEGFVLIDQHWTVLYVNAEGLRLGDRTEQQVVGRPHWEAWSELVESDAYHLYRRVMESREAETTEFQFSYLDGRSAWIEVRAYPAMETGLAVFFRDVTSRKEAEERLRDADRRKDEFLAMLAHELRNPLAPIRAAAELLQLAKMDEARVRKTSEVIARQVTHMTGLIDDLLDVSRVTRGQIELNRIELDIHQVVSEAVEQANPLIRARQHELTIRHAPHTPVITADKKRLVQVLSNVLNNAAKYTPEGGHLSLRTTVDESRVQIDVTDDGIGMTPEMTKHAFDLFAQAERSSDRSSGGLGLGLALVKSMVELNGGSVTCSSDGLGQGSTFSICLPLLREQAPPESSELLESGAETAFHRPLRIMVVDDNVDAAEMLKMLLQEMGHDVLVEHEPFQALERARLDSPQVCLLDIGLPEIDGNELARRLRAQPENSRLVLVAVTGYGQESDRQNAISAGFDYHLVKPVDINALISILRTIEVA